MIDRITARILEDPRFTDVRRADVAGDDLATIEAIEFSGLLSDFAYSEIATALRLANRGI